MTSEKRKIVSKSLLDLFSERERELGAVMTERDETIKDYDEGEDLAYRKLMKDTVMPIQNILKELTFYGNYIITENDPYYNCMSTWQSLDLDDKILQNPSASREDLKILWDTLPIWNNERLLNVLSTPPANYFFTNLDFNTVERNTLGKDLPLELIGTTTHINDASETVNENNFKRLFDAFTDLKTAFINNSSYGPYGIDYSLSTWTPKTATPPVTYTPSFTPFSKAKLGSNAINQETNNSTIYPSIDAQIPTGKYVVCSTNNSNIKIAKIYSIVETKPSITTGGSTPTTTHGWTYQITEIRCLSTTGDDLLSIHKKIEVGDAPYVFFELKKIYLERCNSLKAILEAEASPYYIETNSLKTSLNALITQLGTVTIYSTAANIISLYNTAKTFNDAVAARYGQINTSLAAALTDFKDNLKIRFNKSGSLFNIFRRIEAIDGTYNNYLKGFNKVNFLKTNLITTKVIKQPNNDYTIIIKSTLNEAYGSGGFEVGDTIYILDDNKPELKLKIINIITSEIEDEDNISVGGTDKVGVVKTIKIKILTVDRIISIDFEKGANLRIVKDLV